MGRLAIAWLVGVGITTAPGDPSGLSRFEFGRTEMAVPVRIVLYAPDAEAANGAARAAFDRIRQLNGILSDFDSDSELMRLCRTAGEGRAIPVSEDLWNVLNEAQAISARSCGAFDVTVGPIVRLWRRARRQQQMPPADKLEAARELVGYQLVRLDSAGHAVELRKPGMRLDLGGIAKGYAIDQALAVLREHGIPRALVDAGGDVGLGGPPPADDARQTPGWRVGVAALEAPSEGAPPSLFVRLAHRAIATSGDTWQSVTIGGKRYSHIVDPRTGIGLTDHSSVTVVAPNAMVADALASAVSVLGPEKGLRLIDNMPGAAALVVRAPEGRIETYASRRWKELDVSGCCEVPVEPCEGAKPAGCSRRDRVATWEDERMTDRLTFDDPITAAIK